MQATSVTSCGGRPSFYRRTRRRRCDNGAPPKEIMMSARMPSPAALLPQTAEGIKHLVKAAHSAGVGRTVLELVQLRASQINGCSACVDAGARSAKKNGETDERLFAVAAWRETDYFTDAERAALELAEYATRLADRADPVPDDV